MSNYVYIVSCADGTLYTGMTNDPEKRIRQHNGIDGGGGKYTRSRRPVSLVYLEKCDTKSQALQREFAIKAMSRSQKDEILNIKFCRNN